MVDVPLSGGDEAAAPSRVREHPVAAEPRRVRLPDSRHAHSSSIRPSSSSTSTWSALHQRMLGSRHPSAAACLSALSSHIAAADRSPLPRATSPRTARWTGGWSPSCSSARLESSLRQLTGELELTAMNRDRSPWEEGLAASRSRTGRGCHVRGRRTPPRAPNAHPRTRPTREHQSAAALHSSSRSRHSPYSRSSITRRRRSSEAVSEYVPDRIDRLLQQPRVADGGRKSWARVACAGASASPDIQPSACERVSALDRSASSSSSSASTSAARACSSACAKPILKRVAHASRHLDERLERRTRGRLAQGFLEQRRQHGRRSRARRGGRGPRRATSRSPSRRAGRSRSSGRVSTPPQRDAHELRPALGDDARRARPRGVSRIACSASSAATADAPRSAASARGVVEHARDLGVGHVPRQREMTRAKQRVLDDVRDPSVTRVAAPRRGPGRGPTTAAGA